MGGGKSKGEGGKRTGKMGVVMEGRKKGKFSIYSHPTHGHTFFIHSFIFAISAYLLLSYVLE